MKEIETKIIKVDIARLRKSLKENGAVFKGKIHYRRAVFPLDMRPNEIDEFIRIRTDGRKSTLTYKFRKGKGLANTDEYETSVSDFDKTVEIFSKIRAGKERWLQENYVEKWDYNGADVDICTWPLVPPFVEVESTSEAKIRKAIADLGIDGEEIGNTNLGGVFERFGKKDLDCGDLSFE